VRTGLQRPACLPPVGPTGRYALGMAEVYRRAGRLALAGALLRHALSFLDQTRGHDQAGRQEAAEGFAHQALDDHPDTPARLLQNPIH
jgi:hypothetical protein